MKTSVPLDELKLFGLQEDPALSEQLIQHEQQRAQRDALTAKILESTYWEADRQRAFERFYDSLDFRKIVEFLETSRIERNEPLVEIGGGSGFLSWGLVREGFQDISLLEPNSHYTTGTGYLRTRPDASTIQIENSLDRWYASKHKYNTVITRNCVHHFLNITMAAASIRQKVEVGGHWVMIREPYVENVQEFYRFMHTHPFSQRYEVYEFAYPASHFVNAVELAGFRLQSVIPAGYANNSLSLYTNDEGHLSTRLLTRAVDTILKIFPRATAHAFRIETELRRLLPLMKLFSQPQIMLFRRIEIGNLPESAIWYPMEESTSSLAAPNVVAA